MKKKEEGKEKKMKEKRGGIPLRIKVKRSR